MFFFCLTLVARFLLSLMRPIFTLRLFFYIFTPPGIEKLQRGFPEAGARWQGYVGDEEGRRWRQPVSGRGRGRCRQWEGLWLTEQRSFSGPVHWSRHPGTVIHLNLLLTVIERHFWHVFYIYVCLFHVSNNTSSPLLCRCRSQGSRARWERCSSCLEVRSLWWLSPWFLPSKSVTLLLSTCLMRSTRPSTPSTGRLSRVKY